MIKMTSCEFVIDQLGGLAIGASYMPAFGKLASATSSLSERFENCHNGSSANATALLSMARSLDGGICEDGALFVRESRFWAI